MGCRKSEKSQKELPTLSSILILLLA